MKKLLLAAIGVLALGSYLAWAVNNYRQNTASGGITTFKSTDTAGVHVPHINVDTMPAMTVTGGATEAKQDTGNTSLSSIDTKLTSQATAANQTTGNTSLGTIATNTTGVATAANQSTGNVSLASIDTKLTGTGITPTDRTVASATGASQTVMSANAARRSLTLVNTGNANCGVNPTGGTAAIGGAGTITLAPFGSYTPRLPTVSAVTAICTAGQPLYADES